MSNCPIIVVVIITTFAMDLLSSLLLTLSYQGPAKSYSLLSMTMNESQFTVKKNPKLFKFTFLIDVFISGSI